MNVQFFAQCHTDHIEILPALTIGEITCETCDKDHGVSISLSWLMFSVGIGFVNQDDE